MQTRFGEGRGSETGSTFLQGDTEDTTSGDCEQCILHHVQPGHGQLCAAAMRALENSELRAVLALAYLGGADRSVSCARQGDFAARTRRDAIAERIVCIQDDGPPNAHSFDKGAFLISNRFARTHELDVRNTDVRDDGRIRLRDFRQRRNFTRVIHANLPDSDFVPRRCLQDRSGQPNVIIEISFRLRNSKTAAQHRRAKIFGARLAVASGNRDYF